MSKSGVETIQSQWKEPGSSEPSPLWLPSFTKNITPVANFSHNDCFRSIPLFDALAAGCTGIEADVHVRGSELFVCHELHELNKNRTLKSLYLDPLFEILSKQNASSDPDKGFNGVYDEAPEQTLVLLIDFKHKDAIFPILWKQLEPFREKGWLSTFNPANETLVQGPITVVGSGDTPFKEVLANPIMDIFFDAPLHDLKEKHTTHNSYYASIGLKKAIGSISKDGLTIKQKDIIKRNIRDARAKGLIPRYWGIPATPVELQRSIWEFLVENGIGLLNVDDVEAGKKFREESI